MQSSGGAASEGRRTVDAVASHLCLASATATANPLRSRIELLLAICRQQYPHNDLDLLHLYLDRLYLIHLRQPRQFLQAFKHPNSELLRNLLGKPTSTSTPPYAAIARRTNHTTSSPRRQCPINPPASIFFTTTRPTLPMPPPPQPLLRPPSSLSEHDRAVLLR